MNQVQRLPTANQLQQYKMDRMENTRKEMILRLSTVTLLYVAKNKKPM
jgi:hypothetical protein